jgi:hypothetical protein
MYLLYKIEEVTTLDLKNELRSMGYNAVQKTVSAHVLEYFDYCGLEDVVFQHEEEEHLLAYREEKNHRVYTLMPTRLFDDGTEPEEDDAIELTEPQQIVSIIKALLKEGIANMYKISAELQDEGFKVSPRSVAAYKANITMGKY